MRSILILTAALFFSCTSQEEVSPIPDVEIYMQGVSKQEVNERYSTLIGDSIAVVEDTVKLLFSFIDGDGDLGIIPDDYNFNKVYISKLTNNVINDSLITDSLRSDTTVFDSMLGNVFVVDDRTGFTTAYPMPDILPDGINKVIRGEVELEITTFGCVAMVSDTDYVQYRLFIRDRAGNYSDTITFPEISIICN